jgi:hypothetical protein
MKHTNSIVLPLVTRTRVITSVKQVQLLVNCVNGIDFNRCNLMVAYSPYSCTCCGTVLSFGRQYLLKRT